MNRISFKRKIEGFTIIEFLITVVIVAILVSVAVPSFSDLIKTNRVRTQASNLMVLLQTARSEAVKRGQVVSVCNLNQALVPPSCTASWSNDLSVFVDIDNDGNLDANDAVVKMADGLSGNNVLTWNGPQNWVAYDARGGAAIAAGTFKVCDVANDSRYVRAVIVNPITGRTRMSLDSNGDGTHDDGAVNYACP